MRDAGEYIETRCGATDGFRDQLSGNTGEGDSMAREALEKVHIGRQSPKVRCPVERDVDMAAPGVVHAHIGELGKTRSIRTRVAPGASNDFNPE